MELTVKKSDLVKEQSLGRACNRGILAVGTARDRRERRSLELAHSGISEWSLAMPEARSPVHGASPTPVGP